MFGVLLPATGERRMNEDAWIWTAEARIPSQMGAGAVLLSELFSRLTQEQWSEQDVFGIRLAVEEALVNAVKHGNRFDPDKEVHIVARLSADRLHIEITDQGSGFDATAVPDPTAPENLLRTGGRGLMLMHNFMTRVEFHGRGNRVVLHKRRPPVLDESK